MKTKSRINNKGFALVAAIIASTILLAIGILVISVSTKDLQTSVQTVWDKKALSAVESGLSRLALNFDPDRLTTTDYPENDIQYDATNDPDSTYRIFRPTQNLTAPPIYIGGYSISGGAGWGLVRYDGRVRGNNASRASVDVNVGIGFGPVPMGTISR